MNSLLKKTLLTVVALALVAFAAGCGGDSKTSTESPDQAVKNALAKTAGINSGNATVKASIAVGSLPGSLAIEGGGAFDKKAKGGGAADLQFSVEIAGTEQSFGLVTYGGKSYLTVEGKALEQKDSGTSLSPDQVADFIEGLSKYLTNVKSVPDSENEYTAEVDVKKLLSDSKAGDNLSELSIPGLGSGQKLAEQVGNADITVTIDDEGYAQVLDINLPINANGSQGGVRANIALSDINQPVTIEEPTNVVSSAAELGGVGAAIAGR
ncbi:MAG: hypothetical protein JHD02_10305 [Thermoleophilaceae bacterium]|nr:hypothetical protein [Thermoleophilaceae bacterium]